MHIKRVPGSVQPASGAGRSKTAPLSSAASTLPRQGHNKQRERATEVLLLDTAGDGKTLAACASGHTQRTSAALPSLSMGATDKAIPSASWLMRSAFVESHEISNFSDSSSDDGLGAPQAVHPGGHDQRQAVDLRGDAQQQARVSERSDVGSSSRLPLPLPLGGKQSAGAPTKAKRRLRVVSISARSSGRDPVRSHSAASAAAVSPLDGAGAGNTVKVGPKPSQRSDASEASSAARASTVARASLSMAHPSMGSMLLAELSAAVTTILRGLKAPKVWLLLAMMLASILSLPMLSPGVQKPDSLRGGLTTAGAAAADFSSVASEGVSSVKGGPGSGPGGWNPDAKVRVVTVVPRAVDSPYRTTWGELVQHSAQRLEWTDPSYQMQVFYDFDLGADTAGMGERRRFLTALSSGCQVLLGFGIQDAAAATFLSNSAAQLPDTRLFMESADVSSSSPTDAGVSAPSPSAPSILRGLSRLAGWSPDLNAGANIISDLLAKHASWSAEAKAVSLFSTIKELLSRRNSDDFLFVYLVLINQYVTTVPQVSMTTKGIDFKSLYCMVTRCGSQIMACVNDPVCKAGLDCLQACSFNDQVCQYRCIISHETPKFSDFSLCILQLNNCRGLDATPPLMPNPAAMTSFRGKPMTHEMAEDMFIGWMDPSLGSKPVSWMVAAGKNPAYDYFPCQHQIFYRGRGKGVMWYEPIFKAIKLDGEAVWRHRRYRVRRAETPGTVRMSVLDNGVTSNEFWRIVDCEENYAWCLFYYSGAASTAGLSYNGAVLGTPDGAMPAPEHADRLNAALERCGIQQWELSYVDNSACMGAPLDLAQTKRA